MIDLRGRNHAGHVVKRFQTDRLLRVARSMRANAKGFDEAKNIDERLAAQIPVQYEDFFRYYFTFRDRERIPEVVIRDGKAELEKLEPPPILTEDNFLSDMNRTQRRQFFRDAYGVDDNDSRAGYSSVSSRPSPAERMRRRDEALRRYQAANADVPFEEPMQEANRAAFRSAQTRDRQNASSLRREQERAQRDARREEGRAAPRPTRMDEDPVDPVPEQETQGQQDEIEEDEEEDGRVEDISEDDGDDFGGGPGGGGGPGAGPPPPPPAPPAPPVPPPVDVNPDAALDPPRRGRPRTVCREGRNVPAEGRDGGGGPLRPGPVDPALIRQVLPPQAPPARVPRNDEGAGPSRIRGRGEDRDDDLAPSGSRQRVTGPELPRPSLPPGPRTPAMRRPREEDNVNSPISRPRLSGPDLPRPRLPPGPRSPAVRRPREEDGAGPSVSRPRLSGPDLPRPRLPPGPRTPAVRRPREEDGLGPPTRRARIFNDAPEVVDVTGGTRPLQLPPPVITPGTEDALQAIENGFYTLSRNGRGVPIRRAPGLFGDRDGIRARTEDRLGFYYVDEELYRQDINRRRSDARERSRSPFARNRDRRRGDI